MAQGNRQKCRLLLEGREVPFISATTVSKEGEPLQGFFDLVPLQVIKFVRPRTQIHLFVTDQLMFGDLTPRLAFEGEVVGRGFGKAATGSRYFRVSAIDYSQYWEETRAFFYNPNFVAGKVGEIANDPGTESLNHEIQSLGAATIQSNSTLNSIMVQKLLDPANKDLIEGVTKVIKELLQVNLYYRMAYDRLRIADRIILRSSGRVKEFLEKFKFNDFLLQYTGMHGGATSLRAILNSVLGLVFHECTSPAFPPYLDVKDTTGKPTGNKVIGSFLFIPDTYSIAPPKCNVIFPNHLVEFSLEDDFRLAPTRMSYRYTLVGFTGAQGDSTVTSYPMKYYPNSFRDFMFHIKSAVVGSTASLLDASSLYVDGKGRDYSKINYGGKREAAVGDTALSPTLREADFQTNDESIRGIQPSSEIFPPAVSALARDSTDPKAVDLFFDSIGSYIFFKRRFAARQSSAKIVFNPYVVAGFPCMLLDESAAGQTVTAKVSAVTHSFTNEGCSTSLSLAYARDFDEVDMLSGGAGDPPPPAWYDQSAFGVQQPLSAKKAPAEFVAETQYLKKNEMLTAAEESARSKIINPTIYPKLSTVYQSILGCDAITDLGKESKLVTPRGAAIFLASRYQSKADDQEGLDIFVREYIKRPVATLSEAMSFVGASAQNGVVPEEFAFFQATTKGSLAGRFDGKGFPDEKILKIRRDIIDTYVQQLKERRGFRG